MRLAVLVLVFGLLGVCLCSTVVQTANTPTSSNVVHPLRKRLETTHYHQQNEHQPSNRSPRSLLAFKHTSRKAKRHNRKQQKERGVTRPKAHHQKRQEKQEEKQAKEENQVDEDAGGDTDNEDSESFTDAIEEEQVAESFRETLNSRHVGSKQKDGKTNWVNRNDIDWETCHRNQVINHMKADVFLEDDGDEYEFTEHHAVLYRCDVGLNPFYLRYTHGRSTQFVKLMMPEVLDENYLFSSASKVSYQSRKMKRRGAEEESHTGRGFRIAMCSDTRPWWHYRNVFFPSLSKLNIFIRAVSWMSNGQSNFLRRTDFFKAPHYEVEIKEHVEHEDEDGIKIAELNNWVA